MRWHASVSRIARRVVTSLATAVLPLILIAAAAAGVHAAEPIPSVSSTGFLGSCSGGSPRLTERAGIVYVADGARVTMVDMADVTRPRVIQRINAPFAIESVAAGASGLYALSDGRVALFGLEDPRRPQFRGTYMPYIGREGRGGEAFLATLGDRVWLLTKVCEEYWCPQGMELIDFSSLNAPRLVGRTADSGSWPAYTTSWGSLGASGHLAFVAQGLRGLGSSASELAIFADSGVNRRQILQPIGIYPGGSFSGLGRPRLVGGRLYVEHSTRELSLHLDVIDLTNPAAPTLVREIAGVPSPDFVAGSRGYVMDKTNVRVLDVSEPDRPRLAGTVAIDEPVMAIVATGLRAFVLSHNGHLRVSVLNAANADRPVLMGHVDIPPTEPCFGAVAVATAEHHAYLATGDGVVVTNILDPRHPVQVSTLTSLRAVSRVVAENDRLVALTTGKLQVLDLTDPANPRLIGTLPLLGPVQDLVLVDRTLFVLMPTGLFTYQVGDGDPLLLGQLSLSDARHLAVSGDSAYVATANGVELIDITAPARPVLIRTVSRNKGVLLVDDNYLYVLSYTLNILDRSRDHQAVTNGNLQFGQDGIRWATRWGTMILAGDRRGRVVDVSDPLRPVLRGDIPIPALAQGAAVDGDFAYVAAGYYGLQVLRTERPVDRGRLLWRAMLPAVGGG